MSARELPDGLASGLQHLDLLAGKYERLLITAEAAFDQLLETVKRSDLTPTTMVDLWQWARPLPMKASSGRMAEALGVPITELSLWARSGAPDDFGNHSGEFPPSWQSLPGPGRRLQCVYLLLDENRQVLYVGMSQNIRRRMTDHHKGPHGKRFRYWQMIPCRTREEARSLEGDLIFQHQPPLNVADRTRRRAPK